MGLTGLKWLTLSIIFVISLISGFTTLHIANRYRKLVSMAEALANGIFVGAALFHLLPDAITDFTYTFHAFASVNAILMTVISFALLMVIEQQITRRISNYRHIANVGPLLVTLSIHAFITGLALGISNSYAVVISLLIAILAHKAFEMFALVINLHRQLKHKQHVRILFFIFSFITPLGIVIGTSENAFLSLTQHSLLTAYLNAMCAGTFLYIATIHSHHKHHPHHDGYQKYQQILATLIGIALMGILAFWI